MYFYKQTSEYETYFFILNHFCLKSFIPKYFFDKSKRKNRAEHARPLWSTLLIVNCDVFITSEPTDFFAYVLSQNEIFDKSSRKSGVEIVT